VLAPAGLTAGAPVIGAPALGQNHILAPSALVTGGPVIGSPALAQNHVLAPLPLTAGNPVIGNPAVILAGQISPLPIITGAPVIGNPAISQNHVLAPAPLVTGAPVLSSPALSQNHAIEPALIVTGAPTPGSPALAQNHVLAPLPILTAAPVLGRPALSLTGGEPIMVRSLNENFVTVYPIFKLTVSGNHRPEIHGGDDGIWRRVMLVPFDVQIPIEERDPAIGAKLFAEAPGILNWLIEGARQYLEHGLMVPDQVSAATAEYREDSDPLASFLTQCCEISGLVEDSLRAKDLTAAFQFWMREGGRGEWTDRTVFKRLKAKAGRWK
jgi:hypothetical protein